MNNRILSFIIKASDQTKGAISSASNGIRQLGQAASRAFSGLATVVRNVGMAIGVIAAQMGIALRQSLKIEGAANPFERFVGGMKEAKQHIKDLQNIASSGVIKTDELIEASRGLMNVSNGALGAAKDMKALGDVAAMTGNSVGDIADAVGMAFQQLANGDQISRATRGLERLGIISSETRGRMEELWDSGATAAQVFAILQESISSFAGGIEADAQLGQAAFGRLKEEGARALQEAGDVIENVAVPKISKLAEWLKKIRENGDLQFWAGEVTKTIRGLEPVFSKLTSWIGTAFSFIKEKTGYISAFWGAVSAGEGLSGAARVASQVTKEQKNAQEERHVQAREAAINRASVADTEREIAEEELGGPAPGKTRRSNIGAKQGVSSALSGVRQTASEQAKLDKQIDANKEKEKIAVDESERFKKRAMDDNFRREDDATRKQQQKAHEKYVNLLHRAQAEEDKGKGGHLSKRMKEALDANKADTQAAQAKFKIEAAEAKRTQLMQDSATSLKNIETKIDGAITRS
jgi:hypothetical protein